MAGIAALLVVLAVVVLVESGALPLGLSHPAPPAPPRIQHLTAAGENWTIPSSSPHVVTFSIEGLLEVWTNFTVLNGAVAVFLCNSSSVIHAAAFPACSQEYGAAAGLARASGLLFQNNFTGLTLLSLELVFVNYGPGSDSGAIVYLVWSTPLTVATT